MSLSSRESNLLQIREALLHLNAQFFLILSDRRTLSLRLQELKNQTGRYAHYDPDRELVIFNQMKTEISRLSLKELLAFSLIMEDQAMAMAPGTYPAWSSEVHLETPSDGLHGLVNPLLLKIGHPELFARLSLAPEFSFLKQF